jgi:hypothetical protein
MLPPSAHSGLGRVTLPLLLSLLAVLLLLLSTACLYVAL